MLYCEEASFSSSCQRKKKKPQPEWLWVGSLQQCMGTHKGPKGYGDKGPLLLFSVTMSVAKGGIFDVVRPFRETTDSR